MASIADRVAARGGGNTPAALTGATVYAGGDVACVVLSRVFLTYRHDKFGVCRVTPKVGDTVTVIEAQAVRLTGLGVAERVEVPAEVPQAVTAPVVPPQAAATVNGDQGGDTPTEGRDLTDEEAATLATANMPDTIAFLREHPDTVAAVRAAEEARTPPRAGVMVAINGIEAQAGTAGA
ncbi:MAG: hypothetical protein RR101_14290 [Burkholderiaceae bacterium]